MIRLIDRRSTSQQHQNNETEVESGAVKLEYPDWISPDLIELTLQVWTPRSPDRLSKEDAVRLIVTIQQLLESTGLIALEETNEEVHGLGES